MFDKETKVDIVLFHGTEPLSGFRELSLTRSQIFDVEAFPEIVQEQRMLDSDLPKLLWDSANLITGFVAAQTFTFVFATAQKEFGDSVNTLGIKVAISLLLIVFAFAYGYALNWCTTSTIDLLPGNGRAAQVFKTANYARIAAILMFLGISLLALWVRQLQGKEFTGS